MRNADHFLMAYLLNSFWQIPLLCAVAFAGESMLRNSSARYRHWIWVSALLLCLGLPVWSTARQVAPVAAQSTLSERLPALFLFKAHAIAVERMFSPREAWSYGLALIYCTFLLFRIGQFAWAWRRTRKLYSESVVAELSSSTSSLISQCVKLCAIRPVSVRYSKTARGPLALGVLRPVILLPENFDSDDESDWLAIFAHEVAHIQRRDFLKNLIYELIYLPVSFHPAAMFIHRKVAATRELACDELATERLIEPTRYANSLVTLAGMSLSPAQSQPNYSLGIFDSNILEERIMKLLHRNTTSPSRARMLLGLAIAALAICCISASAFAFRADGGQGDAPPARAIQAWHPEVPDMKFGGIVPPHATFDPEPGYPKSERASRKTVTVVLLCIIGTDGRVKDLRAADSLESEFDKAAINAVRKWKFDPATKDGQPIAVKINVEVDFRFY